MNVCLCEPKLPSGDGDCVKCGRPLRAPVDRRRAPSKTELERRAKITAYWQNKRKRVA